MLKQFRSILILGLAASLLLATGCSNDSTQTSDNADSENELTTVRVGVMTGTVLSYVDAIEEEQGFFAANGIDLDISEFAVGINTVDGVTMGELDVGYAADFAIVNRLGTISNSNLRIFSTADVTVAASYGLYVNSDRIKSLADLEGSSIVITVGTVVEYWVARILEEAGVDADTVTLLPIEGNLEGVAAMQSGQADAIWATGEKANMLDEIDGIVPFATTDDIDAHTVTFLVANDCFLEEQAETVERFLKAFDKFNAFVEADPEYAAALIAAKYSVPEDQILLTINNLSLAPSMTAENVEALDSINSWALRNGLYSTEFDVRNYIIADALKSLYPDRVTY